MDEVKLLPCELIEALGPILRFHETGGHEGDGSDAALARARAALEATRPTLVTDELVERVRKAGTSLIADVRRRYPGEELRCEFMRELDEALAAMPAIPPQSLPESSGASRFDPERGA